LGTGTVTNGVATYSTQSLVVGTYSLTATYSGDANYTSSTSSAISVTAVAFQIVLSTSSLSIAAGQSGQAVLTITPGADFHETVSFSCAGLPLEATCGFKPASVTPNGAAITTTMTITTTAPAARLMHSLLGRGSGPLYALLIPGVMGLVLVGHRKQGVRGMRLLGLVIILAFLTLSIPACTGGDSNSRGGSGSNNPGTPAGTSTVTVTAATMGSTPLSYQVPITLTVTP
jgi:hypothetical protein